MFGDLWLHLTAVLLLVGALSGRPAITVLALLIFLTDGVARLWSILSFKGIAFRHGYSSPRAFHGEMIDLEVHLANQKLLPLLWVEVEEHVPEALPMPTADLVPSHLPKALLLSRSTALGPYDRATWRYQVECAARGYYRVGPAAIRSGDLLGMFPRRQEVDPGPPLLIYPRMVPLPDLGLPERRPFGVVRSTERIFEDPSRFIGLRDYRPNDPLKYVDWKATARRQSLQVRQFEPSTTLNLLVLLNIDTLEHSWEGYIPELLERAVTTAASVARHAFERRWAVGLMANGSFPHSEYPIRIPSGRSPDQLIHILEALAGIMPLTTSSLAELIEEEGSRFPWGATVVCVAALVPPILWASLGRLRASGHPVTVFNVSGKSLEAQVAGVEVVDLAEVPGFALVR